MNKEIQDALIKALEDITRCSKMAGPAGTTAYIISDSRMEAARAAIRRALGVSA